MSARDPCSSVSLLQSGRAHYKLWPLTFDVTEDLWLNHSRKIHDYFRCHMSKFKLSDNLPHMYLFAVYFSFSSTFTVLRHKKYIIYISFSPFRAFTAVNNLTHWHEWVASCPPCQAFKGTCIKVVVYLSLNSRQTGSPVSAAQVRLRRNTLYDDD